MHIIYKDSKTHGNLIFIYFNINFAVTKIEANRSLTKMNLQLTVQSPHLQYREKTG